MYYVVELSLRAIVCYPAGDRMIFVSEDSAKNRAAFLQEHSADKQFGVVPISNLGNESLKRVCLDRKRPYLLAAS
jgi:hypothetical protein